MRSNTVYPEGEMLIYFIAKRISAKRIKVQSNTVLHIKQYALDYLDDRVL